MFGVFKTECMSAYCLCARAPRVGGRVYTIIRVKQSVFRRQIQHISNIRLRTLALVAGVGARIVVIVVTLVVAAVVIDIVRWDLLATPRASTDLYIQIVLHTGLVGWALHSSANPRPHLLVNVLIQRPLLPWLGIRGMWMLGVSLPLRSFVRVS